MTEDSGPEVHPNEDRRSINSDTELQVTQTNLKYPKSVFFIISNEFCERFTYYGMRTILVLYLTQILFYSEQDATVIYHAFISFAYLTPILGAIISDSWWGKFKTIMILSMVYAAGCACMSFGAIPYDIDSIQLAKGLTFTGLILIGLGTGGIKPCVSAFGGDQFVVPQQEKQLVQFFSVFYFSINAGSLISTIVTPILREDVECFDQDSCYSLAFGVPSILMVTAIIFFASGYPLYKIKKPTGSVLTDFAKCIKDGISLKRKDKTKSKKSWMDYAEEKWGRKYVEEVKTVLHVFVLFLPLPVFWTLFDQQGSSWTFQASRMDGDFGGFVIKPDQLQAFNPAIVLFLIPIFQYVIYPFLAKFNILVKPLRRMIVGMLLAALAFIISSFVELAIRPSLAELPGTQEAQLRVYNTLNCKIVVTFVDGGDLFTEQSYEINELEEYYKKFTNVKGQMTFNMNIEPDEIGCGGIPPQDFMNLYIEEKTARTYPIFSDNGNLTLQTDEAFVEDLEKTNDGSSKLRVIHNMDKGGSFVLTFTKKESKKPYEVNFNISDDGWTEVQEIDFGEYTVTIGDTVVQESVYPEMGGNYNYMLTKEEATYFYNLNTVTTANSVNILWQLPQYVVITSGEILFSVTGLEFAFTQAPLSMKSVVTAAWLLTNSIGNIIVIIISEINISDDPIWEMITFAGLMVLATLVFFLITINYKYVKVESEDAKLFATAEEERDNNTRNSSLSTITDHKHVD